MNIKWITFLFLIFLTSVQRILANDIAVANVTLSGRNTTAGTNHASNFNMVGFDLRWKNSWRWNSTNGSISYIGIRTGGSGYSTAPAITISGGGGSGATATATVSGGVLTAINITNPGNGYTSVPTVTISGGGGSGATADAYIQSWWDAAWVFVKFRVGVSNPVFKNVAMQSLGSRTVTLPSVENLRVGMPVRVLSGSATLANDVVITEVNKSNNQITLSALPGGVTSNNNTLEFSRIWEHASLSNTGHIAPDGSAIDPGCINTRIPFDRINNPVVGAFVYRSSVNSGSGDNNFQNVQLRWNYRANQLDDNAIVTVQVFAYEMVYVPQGSFSLGTTDGSESGSFTTAPWGRATASATLTTHRVSSVTVTNGGSGYVTPPAVTFTDGRGHSAAATAVLTNGVVTAVTVTNQGTNYSWAPTVNIAGPPGKPYIVSSEDPIALANVSGSLWGTNNPVAAFNNIGSPRTLPADYPKGFAAFYCMKYEISQGQYRDFLNTLSRAQQDRRTSANLSPGITSVTNRYVMYGNSGSTTPSERQAIRCDASIDAFAPVTFYCDLDQDGIGNELNDGEWNSHNSTNWPDCSALLDWAGLRPMTELEYEKACRGIAPPVAGEYPWGNTTIAAPGANTITLGGTADETVSTATANAAYGNVSGIFALRSGAFAKTGTNRTQSGATYYGIMDMAGNMGEGVINSLNTLYTGIHGNGALRIVTTDQGSISNHDVSGWPNGQALFGFGTTSGICFRGGRIYDGTATLRTSDRTLGDYAGSNRIHEGVRGVRTAQ